MCVHFVCASARWNYPMPMYQFARAQGSGAGHMQGLGHHTWPSHLLGILILHSSPWQGNEPRRVAESPHVTTTMGAYRRVQRATEDHALWDQGRLCLNYILGLGPFGALTAPREVEQMPWAPTNSTTAPSREADMATQKLWRDVKRCRLFPTPEEPNKGWREW